MKANSKAASRYAKLRALADDPRTPAHERAAANLRVKEYEVRHQGEVISHEEREIPEGAIGPPPRGPWPAGAGIPCERCLRRRCRTRPGSRVAPCVCPCHWAVPPSSAKPES